MTRTVNAYALLAMTLGIACTPPPGESQEPPAQEPLWVGILRRDGGLIPIGRYDRDRPVTADPGADVWDQPWPELFDSETTAIAASEQADWRLTTAAPVRWHLYADGERAATLDATQLSLLGALCMVGWGLGVAANAEVETLLNQATGRYEGPVGVVFSQLADAVVPEAEIPALDEILRELGMVDRTEEERRRIGEHTGVDYNWLGFYRFGNLLVGVANGRGYEGEGYQVVEIQGDQGRIVVDVYGGGC